MFEGLIGMATDFICRWISFAVNQGISLADVGISKRVINQSIALMLVNKRC